MVGELLLDIAILSVVVAIGAGWIAVLLGRASLAEYAGLSFPVGAGVFTWVLFVLSWVGLPLTTWSVGLAAVALLLTALIIQGVLQRRAGPRYASNLPEPGLEPGSRSKPILLVACAWLALVAVVAVARSYSTWDAMAIWGVKGYGIALEHSIFAGRHWGAHGLSYPLNVPLLVATFRLTTGDLLPGSKLIFPAFLASMTLGCYAFFRSRRLPQTLSSLGALFVASLPVIAEHGSIGYANLPFAACVVLGTLFSLNGILGADTRRQLLGGTLLAFAGWTRPEGFLIVALLVPVLVVALRASRGVWPHWAAWVGPIVVIIGVWMIFSSVYGSESEMSDSLRAAIADSRAGVFHLDVFYLTLRHLGRQLLTPGVWGLLVPAMAVIFLLNPRGIHPKEHPDSFTVMLSCVSVGVSILAFYYAVSFVGDLSFWLGTGVDRMFLPAGVLAAVLAVMLANDPQRPATA